MMITCTLFKRLYLINGYLGTFCRLAAKGTYPRSKHPMDAIMPLTLTWSKTVAWRLCRTVYCIAHVYRWLVWHLISRLEWTLMAFTWL